MNFAIWRSLLLRSIGHILLHSYQKASRLPDCYINFDLNLASKQKTAKQANTNETRSTFLSRFQPFHSLSVKWNKIWFTLHEESRLQHELLLLSTSTFHAEASGLQGRVTGQRASANTVTCSRLPSRERDFFSVQVCMCTVFRGYGFLWRNVTIVCECFL